MVSDLADHAHETQLNSSITRSLFLILSLFLARTIHDIVLAF
jgi:hypothetical protein